MSTGEQTTSHAIRVHFKIRIIRILSPACRFLVSSGKQNTISLCAEKSANPPHQRRNRYRTSTLHSVYYNTKHGRAESRNSVRKSRQRLPFRTSPEHSNRGNTHYEAAMYMIENIENATSNVALAPLLLSIITLDNQSTTIRDSRHSIRLYLHLP